MNKKSKAVVILCMHRSGSSLVSSLLHHIGVNMGNRCDWKSYDNPKGFYEDKEIVFLNDHILSLYNSSWFDPPDNSMSKLQISNAYRNRIKSMIDERNKNNLWGWKDPRTVFTFHLYEPYLEDYIFICPRRDRNSIAKSLEKRNSLDFRYCLKLIDRYEKARDQVLDAYEASRCWITYENLIEGDYTELLNIVNTLNLEINLSVLNIIDKSLKHF